MGTVKKRCFNLRQKARISYYEPEEPNLDEYIFCEHCGDYVYEYCSVHGALLVVPDDKVPVNPDMPAYVPRAALTIPHVFLHLARSYIPGAGIGVFTTLTLPSGVQFGPYRGQHSLTVTSDYCWQIYDKNNKPSHVVDAADANCSNWMRYVNCARHWHEQNMVAFQYRGQLYYRTIKLIPRFTELLVFYGSEFAHNLNIDLRNYNSPSGLSRKFGAKLSKKSRTDFDTSEKSKIDIIPTTDSHKQKPDSKSCIKDDDTKKVTTKMQQKQKKTKPINSIRKEDTSQKLSDIRQQCDSETKLNQSIDSTNKNVYFDCSVCKYRNYTKESLEKHMRFHDSQLKYVCDVCEYRFKTVGILKTHVLIHKNNLSIKPYKCDSCKYTSTHLGNLKKHMLIHTGEKQFKCTQCNFATSQQQSLKTHMFTHTGEKQFKCTQCNFATSYQHRLKTHMFTHTGEKQFKCTQCNFATSYQHRLKTHMFTHTGEKPFKCTQCKYLSTHLGNLKKHMLIHTGEKQFKCTQCNFATSQQQSLKTHMFTHTGEKPFKCTQCNFATSRQYSVNRHNS